MNKLLTLAALATTVMLIPGAAQARDEVNVSAAATSAPAANVVAGKPLYSVNGGKIGAIYKITDSGLAQVILDGKLVSLPVASLTEVDGKIVTALTRRELKQR